jgi:hypothetical protein
MSNAADRTFLNNKNLLNFYLPHFKFIYRATYQRLGMNGTKFQPRHWMWYTALQAAHPSIDTPIFPAL